MDKDAEIKKLTDEKAFVLGWLDHPITKSVGNDLLENEEKLVGLICNETIRSFETFFAHFEAVGHLRGLRQSRAIVAGRLDEIETQLKDLE